MTYKVPAATSVANEPNMTSVSASFESLTEHFVFNFSRPKVMLDFRFSLDFSWVIKFWDASGKLLQITAQ